MVITENSSPKRCHAVRGLAKANGGGTLLKGRVNYIGDRALCFSTWPQEQRHDTF
jgi:hypothetical protein